MILFIGTEQAGYFEAEVAAAHQMPIQFTGLVLDLQQIQTLALKEKYKYVIINVGMLTTTGNEVATVIKSILVSTSGRIVILAQGYSLKSELIQELAKIGVTNFLTSNNLSEIKEQLEKALKGIDDVIANDIQTKPTEQPKPLLSYNSYKTIAVVGSVSRIGTTTQCIQMAKYLTLQGKKACYIEMNDSGYLSLLKEFYDEGVTVNEVLGKIIYQNVDMFYKKDKISEILKLGYDFYIYDFGTYKPNEFALISFLEKSIKFVVFGTKPNELMYMQQSLQVFYDNDVNYIFTFSPDSEHQDVLELMEEKADNTYFAGYTPDLFFYSSNSDVMHSKMFINEIEGKKEVFQTKEKSSFFGRRKPKRI